MNPELSDAQYFRALKMLMTDVDTVLPYLHETDKQELERAVAKANGNIAQIKIAIAFACNNIPQSDGHPPISFYPYGEVEGVSF